MSKELEAWKRLRDCLEYGDDELGDIHYSKHKKDLNIIETALIRLRNYDNNDTQIKLKALEIIKKKRVDVDYLITCIERYKYPLQFYNEYIKEFNGTELTQEDFDLLKEVLL